MTAFFYRSCFSLPQHLICLQLTEFREREMRRHNPHCYSIPLNHCLKHMHHSPSCSSCKTRGEANRLRATHTSLKPAVTLPFLSTATKAEQYGRVVAFDRRALKRHKAHQRNAMKTTENLERVIRELTVVGRLYS